MQSLKFACRQVVLHPWLSAAVVLVLAVGISTTTAALSVFYQVVLRPIAAPEPERLVDLSETGTKPGTLICSPAGFCDIASAFSYPMFRDLEARQSSFTGIAAQFGFRANVARESDALAGRGMLVSGSYFGVSGRLTSRTSGSRRSPCSATTFGRTNSAVLPTSLAER
jgi:hypothetical protein